MSALAPPPPRGAAPALPPTSPAAFDATRPEVARLLTAIPNFLNLSEAERRQIAADTVRVISYMTDPNGVRAEVAAREARGELGPGGLTSVAVPSTAAPV